MWNEGSAAVVDNDEDGGRGDIPKDGTVVSDFQLLSLLLFLPVAFGSTWGSGQVAGQIQGKFGGSGRVEFLKCIIFCLSVKLNKYSYCSQH